MNELISQAINYINHLGPGEIKILIAVTAFLIFFLVLRRFGVLPAFALALVYLIAYVLIVNNFFDVYQKNTDENNRHMQDIQAEIDKNIE